MAQSLWEASDVKRDLLKLPDDLAVPEDDGAVDHLPGSRLPDVSLPSTAGPSVSLAGLGPGLAVVFIYPRTGKPDQPLPTGWDAIPGARGCTPQTCAFRDLHAEFEAAGAKVFGLSSNPPDYQAEMSERLHLPFPILSDEALQLTTQLRLPTFEVDGMTLMKRMVLFVRDGRIEHVIYPVFPPQQSADQALDWLRANPLEEAAT
jgi:peroxiredoxin